MVNKCDSVCSWKKKTNTVQVHVSGVAIALINTHICELMQVCFWSLEVTAWHVHWLWSQVADLWLADVRPLCLCQLHCALCSHSYSEEILEDPCTAHLPAWRIQCPKTVKRRERLAHLLFFYSSVLYHILYIYILCISS